ncbi:MAG: hypothetical protein M3018_09165 [Actinomycetota bacterium]|nr:hypothetical protein [Actinomycetota bacterium]
MTILQTPPQSGVKHAAKGWCKFGHADEPVRYTDAREHETFAEEQARLERSDPEYARICEAVREAEQMGEEASRRADETKAECDARVAPKRQADDDAQKARHALQADQPVSAPNGELTGSFVPATAEPSPIQPALKPQEVYRNADAVRSVPRV